MSKQQEPRRVGWAYRSDHDIIKGNSKPRRSGCAWNPEEDKDLCAAFARGEPIDALAAFHERTEAAVESRLAINMSALLNVTKAGSTPEAEKATFAVGDFVLCEFRLWQVERVVDGVVREIKGTGTLVGNFTEDRIFPLTRLGYSISRSVENSYSSLHDISRGMQLNFPSIHQQFDEAWQSAMKVLDQDAELEKAMREIHAMYSEFLEAIDRARATRVRGISLFR